MAVGVKEVYMPWDAKDGRWYLGGEGDAFFANVCGTLFVFVIMINLLGPIGR